MSFLSLGLETTGIDPATARIVEVAITRHGPDDDAATIFRHWINPGIPIPPEASACHGITDDAVRDVPKFATYAAQISGLLREQTVIGFNIHSFDLPILCEEMERAQQAFDYRSVNWIDVRGLDVVLRPRDLKNVVGVYLGQLKAEDFALKAHGAEADALATAQVYEQMRFQTDAWEGKTAVELAKISRYDRDIADPAGKLVYIDGVLCYAFGKHKGIPVAKELAYADWMLRSDFPATTKRFIREWAENERKSKSK